MKAAPAKTQAGPAAPHRQKVINVDLPWNPAVLEQRISRAHRMGQKRPVHVFLLVTTDTLEENLPATLSAKHELSPAVLDPEHGPIHGKYARHWVDVIPVASISDTSNTELGHFRGLDSITCSVIDAVFKG